MNKFIKLIESKLMPIANKIASNDILNAIRHSMMGMAPFFMIGSFFMLAAYFPSNGYQEFLNSTFGEGVFQGDCNFCIRSNYKYDGIIRITSSCIQLCSH